VSITMASTSKAVRIPSVKHKRTVLYHEGYSYHFNQRSEKAKTTYYRCKLKGCPGTGKTVDGQEFKTMRGHSSHPVTPLKKEVSELRDTIKRRTVAEGSGGIKIGLTRGFKTVLSS
jgi:hypothetical protein